MSVIQIRSPEKANTSKPNASSLSRSSQSVSAARSRSASDSAMQDRRLVYCRLRNMRMQMYSFGDSTRLRCKGHSQTASTYPKTMAKSIRPEIADCFMACIFNETILNMWHSVE